MTDFTENELTFITKLQDEGIGQSEIANRLNSARSFNQARSLETFPDPAFDRGAGALKGATGIAQAGVEKVKTGIEDITGTFKEEGILGEEKVSEQGIDRSLQNRASQFFRGLSRIGAGALTAGFGVTPVGIGSGAVIGALEPEVQEGIETLSKTEIGKASIEAFNTLSDVQKEGVINILESAPFIPKGSAKALAQGIKTPITIAKATKNKLFPEESIDDIVKKIAQAQDEDVPKLKKALGKIDVEEVTSFKDLEDISQSKIKELSKRVDNELLKDTKKRSLNELVREVEVDGQKVTSDFVQRSIDDLKDLYEKIGDDVALSKINKFEQKVKSEGINLKETNDFAREYGVEFKKKAFTKKGDPKQGVNATRFETNRKGIKETVRQFTESKVAQELDFEISSLFNLKESAQKLRETVQNLKNKIKKRGIGEKIGGSLANALDLITGGATRGFISKLVPRSVGFKILNSLDLEESLQKNLRLFEKLNKATTDKQLSAGIKELQKQNPAFLEKVEKTVKTEKLKKNLEKQEVTFEQTQSLSKPETAQTTLKEQAKKFDSAEEFIKNQNKKIDFLPEQSQLLRKIKKENPDVELFFSEDASDIILSKIIVPKSGREKGVGTKIMKEIINKSEESGKRILLTPSKDFGGSLVRLKSFYKKLGFKENKGRNKDFSTRESFIFTPKILKQQTN